MYTFVYMYTASFFMASAWSLPVHAFLDIGNFALVSRDSDHWVGQTCILFISKRSIELKLKMRLLIKRKRGEV